MERKYDIPRKKKRGQHLMGIEMKGWGIFAPCLLFYLGAVYVLPISVPKKVVIFSVLAYLTGYCLQTDDKTGEFVFMDLFRFVMFISKNQTYHLSWGGRQDEKALSRVREFKREAGKE